MNILRMLLFYLIILFQCVIDMYAIVHLNENIINDNDLNENANESEIKYVIKKFTVPIDHFNFAISHTFDIRYLVDDTWQKENNAPIFFYTGNDGKIEDIANITGFLWDIAPIFQALIVFAEHRYYGESLPYGNRTYSNAKNLAYLSSQQALLDYVDLIEFLRTDPKLQHSPVIAFGGSYAGQLAAWIRLKYPHAVQGAIASSAPMLQFPNITDCYSFTRIVTSNFREVNPICPKVVHQSWDAINNLTSTASGKRWIFIMWDLCKSLKSKSDVQHLKDWLTNAYITMSMSNYPYAIYLPTAVPASPIKQFCKYFTKANLTNEKLLMVLKRAINAYSNFTGQTSCIATTDATRNFGEIGWDYQTCTELVMPVCSDGINDMFEPRPWYYEELVSYCKKRYNVIPDSNFICKQYGCTDFQTASNIVFSNGLLDPWSSRGVLTDLTRSAIAVTIPSAAHQFDLRQAKPTDYNSVIRARDIHRNLIKKWIRDYNEYIKKKYLIE